MYTILVPANLVTCQVIAAGVACGPALELPAITYYWYCLQRKKYSLCIRLDNFGSLNAGFSRGFNPSAGKCVTGKQYYFTEASKAKPFDSVGLDVIKIDFYP